MGCIPKTQGSFNIQISINVIHHTNRLGKKNHTIIITDSEKAYPFLIKKNHKQVRNRRKLPQPDKERLQKPTPNILLNHKRLTAFHLRLRAKQ